MLKLSPGFLKSRAQVFFRSFDPWSCVDTGGCFAKQDSILFSYQSYQASEQQHPHVQEKHIYICRLDAYRVLAIACQKKGKLV